MIGMLGMENWRDIKGYEGHYQVSDLGNVRSLRRVIYVSQARFNAPRRVVWRGKVLKQGLDGKGYLAVRLCILGRVRNKSVHRLVAEHFISNHLGKPAVNHIDCNHLNNEANNLEWCTIRENNLHTRKMGRSASIYKSTFNQEQRESINTMLSNGMGATEIAKLLGAAYCTVRYIQRLRNSRLINAR